MPTGSLPFPATLGEITSAAVRETMEMCGGNKSDAARRLRISRPRLQRILDAIANDETDTGEDYE
ncbi:MAG: helix-turn-helix domain-containing protein [Gemmatimonadaceae bacterium]